LAQVLLPLENHSTNLLAAADKHCFEWAKVTTAADFEPVMAAVRIMLTGALGIFSITNHVTLSRAGSAGYRAAGTGRSAGRSWQSH